MRAIELCVRTGSYFHDLLVVQEVDICGAVGLCVAREEHALPDHLHLREHVRPLERNEKQNADKLEENHHQQPADEYRRTSYQVRMELATVRRQDGHQTIQDEEEGLPTV